MTADNETEPTHPESRRPPRFCRHCGTELNLETGDCPTCGELRDEPPGLPREKSPASAHRLFGFSLTLYFALLATGLASLLSPWDDVRNTLIVTAIDSALVLVWMLFSRRALAPGFTTFPSHRWFLLAVTLPLATFLVASVAVEALTVVFAVEEYSYTGPFSEAGYGAPWAILVICVQPAVIEEIAFRGIILSGMRQVLEEGESILVSSLLFTTIHLSVLSFPHLLMIGLVLGYLRSRTGSLYPGMVLHFTHNLLCVVSEYMGV